MMFEKVSNKIIAIGGAVAVIGTIIALFGFQIISPSESLSMHVQTDSVVHSAIQAQIDSTEQATQHIEHIEMLLESILRGECLENPRDNLARQGLLAKCAELGIAR